MLQSASSLPSVCNEATDGSCYCVPAGICYPIEQRIDIDNCWIDQISTHHLVVEYSVVNGAGLSANGNLEVNHSDS